MRSLGIKTNKNSLDNHGLKNPVQITIKKF